MNIARYLSDIYHKIMANPKVYLMPAILFVGVFVVAAILWWVFNIALGRAKKRLEKRPFFQRNDYIFPLIKKAGHYTILIIAGARLLQMFKADILERMFYAFLVIFLASFAKSLSNHMVPVLERTLAARTDTKIDDVILDLFKSFSGVIIYGTAGIFALDILGLNIMPVVAGAGVAGLAVGFAAKDTLSNLIAGVLLIIDRPFEVGDRIEVWTAPKNSATWGDVIDIGLRATKIRTTDNIVIIIPNNEIMRRDIINYTTITKEIRVRISIGIAYEADVGKAKKVIIDIARELDWVMEDPEPKVVVKNFGESSVDLEARVWISEPRRRIDTISHITDRVKEAFQKEGIEIPYPKRDIFIKKEVEVSKP